MKNEQQDSRGRLWIYGVELATTIALGLGFLLILLWMLNLLIPGSGGLGELIRSADVRQQGRANLAFGATSREMIAVLQEISNDVQERPPSSVVWSVADPGHTLEDRHAVQTQSGSSAIIAFDEETTIELAEKSVIVVRKPRPIVGTRRKRASVLFMDGFLRGRVGAGAGDVELELVASGGTVRAAPGADGGAEIELTAVDDRSALTVHSGSVELDLGGRAVRVPEGHAVTYDAHGSSRVVAIPTAPKRLSPANGTHLAYRASPPPVHFAWTSKRPVDGFRLEIARDASFEDVVFDRTLPETRFVHENLTAGSYHWRVRARSGELDGRVSPTGMFVVERDDVAPSLVVRFPETVDGPLATIGGRTEPGSRVFVGELEIPVGPNGEFVHEIDVRDGYNFVVVQSVDPTGNATFRNETILARNGGTESVR